MTTLKVTLQRRKIRIEERLKTHGISETSISFLRYLMFDEKEFATPYEVGCRIIIIYAIAFTIEEQTKKQSVVDWLKRESIWEKVGYREAQYLEGNETEEEQINDFSWQMEGAYILAWTLNLIKEPPSPKVPVDEKQIEHFCSTVPPLGTKLGDFLGNLNFRKTEEIFEENIFYELTTAYFRDLLFSGKEDSTEINRIAAFERHKALNWLRRYMYQRMGRDRHFYLNRQNGYFRRQQPTVHCQNPGRTEVIQHWGTIRHWFRVDE